MPYYNRDPRRDHNFDNHPHIYIYTYMGDMKVILGLYSGDIGIMENKMETTRVYKDSIGLI